MYGFSYASSAGIRSDSRVVWKSAMRFCVRRRIRLRPMRGYSRGDGGRTVLGNHIHYTPISVTLAGFIPEICVQCLQLGEISFERGYVSCAYTPKCTHFKYVAWT